MQKILAALVVVCILWGGVLHGFAAELKVGDKAADFSLKDSTGKAYSLHTPELEGKVLSIFYVDPDEKDLNHHVEEALLKDKGLERNVRYKGLGITNLKASKMPKFLIKSAIKDKQKKTGSLILLDADYMILNLWGLKNHTSSLVILDKDRICRYVHNGKLSLAETEKVLKIIKEYQVK